MDNHNNKVSLVLHAGGDLSHAAAAWTSTGLKLTPEQYPRIPKLMQMLRDGSDGNEHGTPFEKSYLQFNVTCDTASHIHILKHRIGVSVNGESARYKEYREDKFYVPADWPEASQDCLIHMTQEAYAKYHEELERLIAGGMPRPRAKETTRYFLPYNIQVKLDVSFNFRSFVHFQKLRNAPHAQLEINEIAKEMMTLVHNIPDEPFKHSLKAYGYENA